MSAPSVVTLLTDFGLTDPYVGVMKGVILTLAPAVQLVDITHGVPPQDIATASVYLTASAPYFPDGTVHVAVVDPGVGGPRRAVAVETSRAWYVAPDNGLLSAVLADEDLVSVTDVTDSPVLPAARSSTFHGRDVFAPIAARLASGARPSDLGDPVPDLVITDAYTVQRDQRVLTGRVLFADHFGNLVTNVRRADVPESVGGVALRGHETWSIGPPVAYYAAVPDGAAMSIWNSFGLLEISIRGGSMADAVHWRPGATVEVSVEL